MNDFSIDEKMAKHRETYEHYQPVLGCSKCGSTMIDQMSDKLMGCNSCGNSWDYDIRNCFIRRRSEYEDDAINGLKLAQRKEMEALLKR